MTTDNELQAEMAALRQEVAELRALVSARQAAADPAPTEAPRSTRRDQLRLAAAVAQAGRPAN